MISKSITYLIDEKYIIDMRGEDTHAHSSVCVDSRKAATGTLFIAIKGTGQDGHKHIEHAIDRGATGIVCEVLPENLHEHITYVVVENSKKVVGMIASRFYGDPSQDMVVVGVTGTNGKTTIATLLYQIFTMTGHKTGLISTAETIIGQKTQPRDGAPTTPGALHLQGLLYDMKQAGCTHVCMEVSSHGAEQHRVLGTHFAGGIFTNITHDHLDYHGTFEAYLNAKQSFFDMLPPAAFALANIDDENGPFMLQNTAASTHYYGLNEKADFDLNILKTEITGSQIQINEQDFSIQIPGAYNAYNVTAAYAAAVMLGIDPERLTKILPKLVAPPGRFELIPHPNGSFGVLDYSHSPDALDNLLQTIRDVTSGDQKIITVVGAGGDRDPSKRSTMGRIAADLSDLTIFTSDNPRNEEPLEIIAEMKSGLYLIPEAEVIVSPNRAEAIQLAVTTANPNDIVVLAGKGHEDYQEVLGQKMPFSDKDVFLKSE